MLGKAAGSGIRGPKLEAMGRELDGLTAIMESHFNYEERAISKALDAEVPNDGWPELVFGFGHALP